MNLPTYIINLKHRTDRYEHMVTEMKKLPVSYEFIDAVSHETSSIGCFQSHLKCIKLAKENKFPYVLILEDDVIFTDDVVNILQKILKLNESYLLEWDMLYLGANLQSPAIRINSSLIKLTGAYTTHAYMIHERFYDVILNLFQTFEIDVHYYNLMPEHNIFMCDPIVAYQLPSYTDLQDGYRDYNDAIFNNYLKYKP